MFGQHGLVLLFVLILVVVVLVFGLKYLRMWIDQCNYKNAREDDAQARRKIALDTKDASQLDVRVMTSTGWTRPASAWPWVGRSPVGRAAVSTAGRARSRARIVAVSFCRPGRANSGARPCCRRR